MTTTDREARRAPGLPNPKLLFDQGYTNVCRYFLRKGFTLEQARDLTQETFLEAIKTRNRYRGEASPLGWLLGIAQNVYRESLRHENRQKRSADHVSIETWLELEGEDATSSASEHPIERSLAEERARLFREAITALPPGQRTCLLLRIDQDLSYREIAELLDLSLEAVKARLFQGKKALRDRLGEHFVDDLH